MDSDASFEAKLQENLEAIVASAEAAKRRIADGVAGLRPPPPSAAPRLASPGFAPVPAPEARTGPAVSFDDVDAEGIPVWEEPT